VFALVRPGAADAKNVNFAENEQICRWRMLALEKFLYFKNAFSWVFLMGISICRKQLIDRTKLNCWRFEPASDHSQDRFLDQIFVRARILPIDNESLSGSHLQNELIVTSIIGKCVISPSARINRFLHPHQKQQMKTTG
jgi:hypothetical protein